MHRGVVFKAVAISLLIGIALSCSKLPSSQENGIPVTLDVPLQSAAGLEQLVERVVLRIYAEDMRDTVLSLPVTKGRVSRTIDVPPGEDRIFEMRAVDAGERVLYFGADTVSIGQALEVEVNISLMPVILLMCISPRYQEVNIGSPCTMDIHIFNVDSLYGAAFKLLYDPTHVRVDDCEVGGFLGTGTGVIFEKYLESDSVAVSYIRTRDVYEYGVSGSGRLARVHLTPLASGQSVISLAIHSEQALIKKQEGGFAPIDGIEELYLDAAIVVGRGSEL